MNKERLTLAILVVITLTLTAGAVYQKSHRDAVQNTAVQKADAARDLAQTQADTAKLNLQAAQASNQTLAAQKLAVCNLLAVHKLSDPVCLSSKE